VSVSKQQLSAASRWLNDLADLTAGQQPLAEAKTKLAAMAPALAEEFDASAFNRGSLVYAARRCKFFPTFSEACDALSEWRKQHPPAPRHTAIAGPDGGSNERQMREIEEQHAAAEASWQNISEPAIFAKVRALDGHPMRLILGRMLADAVRRHAPRLLGLLPPEFLAANDDRSAA
jgi:hypothetical protein